MTALEALNVLDTRVLPPCADSEADHLNGLCTRTQGIRTLILDFPHGRLVLLRKALEFNWLLHQVQAFLRDRHDQPITEEAIRIEVSALAAMAEIDELD